MSKNKEQIKNNIVDVLSRLKEGRRSEKRVLQNYLDVMVDLYDINDIEIILGIIRDEKKHVLMVEGLINILNGKLKKYK